MRRARFPLAIIGFVSALGCTHLRAAPHGYNVSSERSDYTPSLRLAVAVPTVDSAGGHISLTIAIDSGMITAVGGESSDTVAAMRDLYLTALLVTAAPKESGSGPPSPWHPVAESDSILVIDALKLGEARRLPPVRLHVATSTPLDPGRVWLVFRISAGAMTTEIRMADGQVVPARRVSGAVRVFACSDWTLAGYVDRRRAKALARAYNAAC